MTRLQETPEGRFSKLNLWLIIVVHSDQEEMVCQEFQDSRKKTSILLIIGKNDWYLQRNPRTRLGLLPLPRKIQLLPGQEIQEALSGGLRTELETNIQKLTSFHHPFSPVSLHFFFFSYLYLLQISYPRVLRVIKFTCNSKINCLNVRHRVKFIRNIQLNYKIQEISFITIVC